MFSLTMLNNITIYNYRNLAKFSSEISTEGNLVVADNGSGKTNLLESIYYSVYRNSFRPMENASQLIGMVGNSTSVVTEWDFKKLEFKISHINRLQQNYKMNNKFLTLANACKQFPVLIFAPNSIDLVNGEPSLRRKDLDNFLSSLNIEYAGLITRYKAVLKNRNALIKLIRDGRSQKHELDYWNTEISRLALEVYRIRKYLFSEISTQIEETSKAIYHDVEDLKVLYRPNFLNLIDEDIEEIKQIFTLNLEKEIIVGKTLYGVHKDDLTFEFTDKSGSRCNLKFHGSRGQQRLGSFIFKMSEIALLQNKNDNPTLFLIDDIMSELDKEHRENISNYLINSGNQFILTGAEISEIPKSLIDYCKKVALVGYT